VGSKPLREYWQLAKGWSKQMRNTLKKFFNYFRPRTEEERVYEWLSESSDLVDLERRQRALARNQAPFQTSSNMRAKGYYS
jgi:hypothetical protein